MVYLLHLGAMGIFLGKYLSSKISIALPISLLVLAILLLFYVQRITSTYTEETIHRKSKLKVLWIIVLIGISIAIRSIGGSAIAFSWQSKFILAFIYTIGIVVGKAFGGLLGDKFGFEKVAIGGLLLSMPFIFLGHLHFIFGCIGIFLFNIPMAITLTVLENTLRDEIAFAVRT